MHSQSGTSQLLSTEHSGAGANSLHYRIAATATPSQHIRAIRSSLSFGTAQKPISKPEAGKKKKVPEQVEHGQNCSAKRSLCTYVPHSLAATCALSLLSASEDNRKKEPTRRLLGILLLFFSYLKIRSQDKDPALHATFLRALKRVRSGVFLKGERLLFLKGLTLSLCYLASK